MTEKICGNCKFWESVGTSGSKRCTYLEDHPETPSSFGCIEFSASGPFSVEQSPIGHDRDYSYCLVYGGDRFDGYRCNYVSMCKICDWLNGIWESIGWHEHCDDFEDAGYRDTLIKIGVIGKHEWHTDRNLFSGTFAEMIGNISLIVPPGTYAIVVEEDRDGHDW
jgi:hypothetical protein